MDSTGGISYYLNKQTLDAVKCVTGGNFVCHWDSAQVHPAFNTVQLVQCKIQLHFSSMPGNSPE